VEKAGLENAYRVARGLEEIWGRLRNSSRSMVPELSWMSVSALQHSREAMCACMAYLVQLHEALSYSLDLIAINCQAQLVFWEVIRAQCSSHPYSWNLERCSLGLHCWCFPCWAVLRGVVRRGGCCGGEPTIRVQMSRDRSNIRLKRIERIAF